MAHFLSCLETNLSIATVTLRKSIDITKPLHYDSNFEYLQKKNATKFLS